MTLPLSESTMLFVCPAQYPSDHPQTLALTWAQPQPGGQDASGRADDPRDLPAGSEIALVCPALALSWHRVNLPRIASQRMALALSGLLEDRLLSDPETLQFGLEPGAQPGQPAWVAVVESAWLRHWVDRLTAAGHSVRCAVPESTPVETTTLGVWRQFGRPHLVACGPSGVRVHALPQRDSDKQDASSLADFLQWFDVQSAACNAGAMPMATTEPDLLAKAVEVCGRPFAAETLAQRWSRSAEGGWDLLSVTGQDSQKGLAGAYGQRKGGGAGWRLARWGLVAWAMALVGGLNASAWHASALQQELLNETRRVVQSTFPHIDLVLNAPVQMRRELERQQTGAASGHSLEHLLQSLAGTDGAFGQLTALDFDAQGARLVWAPGNPPDAAALTESLNMAGWDTSPTGPTSTTEWQVRPSSTR